jgi:hypothetical protein
MKILVFKSKGKAKKAERAIYDGFKSEMSTRGFLIDADGVHGKKRGRSHKKTRSTTGWSEVTSKDGKHFVLHPERRAALFSDLDSLIASLPRHTVEELEAADDDLESDRQV